MAHGRRHILRVSDVWRRDGNDHGAANGRSRGVFVFAAGGAGERGRGDCRILARFFGDRGNLDGGEVWAIASDLAVSGRQTLLHPHCTAGSERSDCGIFATAAVEGRWIQHWLGTGLDIVHLGELRSICGDCHFSGLAHEIHFVRSTVESLEDGAGAGTWNFVFYRVAGRIVIPGVAAELPYTRGEQ